jgi:phosphate transport system protein
MPIDLQDELIELRRAILTMGASVEQRMKRSVEALFRRDAEQARVIRTTDKEIDQMEIDIEAACLRILALSQPLAGDLRFVLAVMRITNELERIGDMAKSVAKRAIDLDELPPLAFPSCLHEMADRACEMVSQAVTALADGDAELARRTRLDDQRVDDLLRMLFAWSQEEILRNVEATQATIDMLSIGKKLERVADVATNIAEDVIFMSEGAVVRHRAPMPDGARVRP